MSNENKDTATKIQVIKTIAYYDALGCVSLTAQEIKKYIKKERDIPSLFDIEKALNELLSNKKLKHRNGFWTLNHNDKSASLRIEGMKSAAVKWQVFNRKAGFLPYLPYVRSVAVTGSTALFNSSENSDIDILITCKYKHIWTTRFVVTVVSFMLGRRRYGDKTKDRLCFNQYKTERQRTFGPENIDNVVKNIHIPAWSHNAPTSNDCILYLEPNKHLLKIKRVLEMFLHITFLGKTIEYILGNMQIKKIKNNALGYPPELGKLDLNMDNLIFYHPKVRDTEARYRHILNAFIGYRD
ncbi:MAG: hypothetical protein WDZ39_00205 [Candidatus Spechtbacterales bacterium]